MPRPLHALAALVLALAPMLAAPAAARAGGAPADTLSRPLAPPPRVRAWQLGLARADRLQHASLAASLAAGLAIAGAGRTGAFASVVAVGALKECDDARHSRFDPVDLAADVLGAFGGACAGAGRPR